MRRALTKTENKICAERGWHGRNGKKRRSEPLIDADLR
jgi:hypothetical protein